MKGIMPTEGRSVSNFCTQEVVEAVLDMMDQGPQPMRNMKPSKKVPNGADHFEAEHESGYKDYEKQESSDCGRQVDSHNAACPKLTDELEKRRSTIKTEALSRERASRIKPTNLVYYDPKCRICQKLKQAAEAKKRNPRAKPTRKRKKESRRSRVTKPRRRAMTAKYRISNLKERGAIRANRGSRYPTYTNKGTSADLNTDGSKVNEESELLYFSKRNSHKPGRNSQAMLNSPSESQQGSKTDFMSPDTSANSLSSYNSNMSLDHEPMVSP